MKPVYLVLALGLAATLSSCDRYRVTFNDRVVSEPQGLLKDVQVEDKALQACIAQTIADRGIRAVAELTTLICSHGGIRSLEGIQRLSGIAILNLGDNAITSVAPLLFLGELKSVNLAGNKELDCEELAKLAKHLPTDGALLPPKHCGGS